MRYFAELDSNNTVLRVIVAEQAVIDGMSGTWIETTTDNYAGKGHEYDETNKKFFRRKPVKNPSWVKDVAKGGWKPPKEKPTLPLVAPFQWEWSEADLDWVQTEIDTSDPKERNGCLLAGNCVIDPVTNKIVDK